MSTFFELVIYLSNHPANQELAVQLLNSQDPETVAKLLLLLEYDLPSDNASVIAHMERELSDIKVQQAPTCNSRVVKDILDYWSAGDGQIGLLYWARSYQSY